MKLEANKEFMEISPYKYTCMAPKAFKAMYSICRSAAFIRLSRKGLQFVYGKRLFLLAATAQLLMLLSLDDKPLRF